MLATDSRPVKCDFLGIREEVVDPHPIMGYKFVIVTSRKMMGDPHSSISIDPAWRHFRQLIVQGFVSSMVAVRSICTACSRPRCCAASYCNSKSDQPGKKQKPVNFGPKVWPENMFRQATYIFNGLGLAATNDFWGIRI